MALTEIPVELSSTPGIVDGSNATAITIDSSERVFVGKTATGLGTSGIEINPGGYIQVTESQSPSLYLNRLTDAGGIINLYKAGTQTGVIGTDNWVIGGSTVQGGGLLTLEGADANMLVLHRTADTGDQGILFYDHGDHNATIYGKNGGALEFRTNGNSIVAMHLDSSGRAGIGTVTPGSYNANADDLVIFDDNVHAGMTIAGGTNDYGNIYFAQGTSGSDQYRGYIQYGHSATTDANYRDMMVFGTATLERLKIHGDGSVTMPAQPCAGVSSADQSLPSNLTTLVFDTERFDQSGDFDTSTYKFNAPVTGKYLVTVNLYLKVIDNAAAYYQLYIVSDNKTYYSIFDPNLSNDADYWDMTWSAVIDMDASDKVYFRMNQSGGTAQTVMDAQSYASFVLVA